MSQIPCHVLYHFQHDQYVQLINFPMLPVATVIQFLPYVLCTVAGTVAPFGEHLSAGGSVIQHFISLLFD